MQKFVYNTWIFKNVQEKFKCWVTDTQHHKCTNPKKQTKIRIFYIIGLLSAIFAVELLLPFINKSIKIFSIYCCGNMESVIADTRCGISYIIKRYKDIHELKLRGHCKGKNRMIRHLSRTQVDFFISTG